MRTINISVRDKLPVVTAMSGTAVQDNRYKLLFDFDDEWQTGLKSVVVVGNRRQYVVCPTETDEVEIELGDARVVYVGVIQDVIATSRPCQIIAEDSIKRKMGVEIVPPSEDVWTYITEQIRLLNAAKLSPVDATSDMTQPVGRDAQGRLFTEPTGGGGSGTVTSVAGVEPDESGNVPLTPADIGAAEIEVTDEEINLVTVTGTAAVGQTIVVDTVDEDGYPVTWHAVDLPRKTSELQNDSGFITRAVSDLANYYRKSETYTQAEVNALVSAIPKFTISVVNALPTSGISETTVYLVKSGTDSDLYTEYIYVNGAWEILGSQRVDLTGYATEAWVDAKLSDYITAETLTAAIIEGALGYIPAKQTDIDGLSAAKADQNTVPNAASVDGNTLKMQRKTTADDGTETTSDLFEAEIPASGTSGIPLVGAAAGQIPQISAVDENGVPTEWIPVDLPSGGSDESEWRLLCDVTLEEESNNVILYEGEWTAQEAMGVILPVNTAGDNAITSNVSVWINDLNGNPILRTNNGYWVSGVRQNMPYAKLYPKWICWGITGNSDSTSINHFVGSEARPTVYNGLKAFTLGYKYYGAGSVFKVWVR